MRKILLILFVSLILIFTGGCLKGSECKSKTVQDEQPQILSYAASNGISATAHSTGVYYQVINQGSGPAPIPTSKVSVKYKGKLLNGTVFDSTAGSATITFTVGEVIPGWQIGLSLIQKGGKIKLIIPSSLAYGCEDKGVIPPNSVLYFDIDLVDVQ